MASVAPFPDRYAAAREVIAQLTATRFAEPPGWWLDQMRAANAEAFQLPTAAAPLLTELEPDRWRNATPVEQQPTDDQQAMLFAAIMG